MFGTAIGGALATIQSGLKGSEESVVDAAGDQGGLAGQAGDPEGMDDIGRFEVEVDGVEIVERPEGHVHFVGGVEVVLGVAEVPPPLMAHDGDEQVVGREVGRSRLGDDADDDEEDDEDGEERGDRPGELEPAAAVDLRWLGIVLVVSAVETDQVVDHRAHDQGEDDQRDPDDEPEEAVDLLG